MELSAVMNLDEDLEFHQKAPFFKAIPSVFYLKLLSLSVVP